MAWESPRFYFFSTMPSSDQPRSETTISGCRSRRSFALVSLTAPFRRYRSIVLGVAVALICAIELRQYIVLAVQFPLYELVSEGLLRAVHILKSP